MEGTKQRLKLKLSCGNQKPSPQVTFISSPDVIHYCYQDQPKIRAVHVSEQQRPSVLTQKRLLTHPALCSKKYTTTLDREIAYHGGIMSMINNLLEQL